MTTWQSTSEIVCGKVIQGQIAETAVRPELFIAPYNNVIKIIKREKTWTLEQLISVVGMQPVTSAIQAATSISDDTDINWVQVLETTWATHSAGVDLEKLGQKMQRGEPNIDLSLLHEIAQRAVSSQGKVSFMTNIEAREVPFILSGYKPLDVHMGGIPEVGLITVGGATKSGKTTWSIRVVIEFLRLYKEKQALVFSIEMMEDEYKMRAKELDSKLEVKDENGTITSQDEILSRWAVVDGPVLPEQVANIASQIENLGLIVIDFADLMIMGEASESKYAAMYITLMLTAKKLRCPIILLAQFNRQYKGGIPRPTYLRYTGLAEALSWMLITLWNPEISYHEDLEDDEEIELPIIPGQSHQIVWLCRGGFRIHKTDSPGSISSRFNGEIGYDYTRAGTWYSLRKEPKQRTKKFQ